MDQYTHLPEPQLAYEIQDSLLRLIFTCCHPLIPPEAQVALTLTWKEIHIFRCQDGQIVEHWGVFDMLGILQQLGAIPG